MFIEPLLTTIRAPAERNVSGAEWKSSTFRSSGAMRNLLEVVLSINISSLRDEEAAPGKRCQKNKKLRTCYAEVAETTQRRNESIPPPFTADSSQRNL